MTLSPVPPGYQTITPYLAVHGGGKFLAFLRDAFGAEETAVSAGDDGTIFNAEVRIGTSMVMVADTKQAHPMPAQLYLYVTDADALFERAVAAGAKVIMPMEDKFYGDRSGGVQDAWGNQWWISMRVKNVPPEEVARIKMGK